ncbi:methyltransferase domain-containing protein [Yinghuangia soli]|uniref:Methyltransferase domain-containing protein n=1 Tax=Yinghuangia soli TaxID=2908204 RepID=A0AA41PXB2_9ACTN|nr:methyltransferase domain-containing protein [Yinghuangia soli]MCF2527411.1 methyltransferase domain-containing protein [Yinghuangia soli]
MLHDVVGYLRCPHCGAGLDLAPDGRSLRCSAGRHTFDVARQGYANLLGGDAKAGTADTAEMVAARDAFLGAGHYKPIAEALAADALAAEAGAAAGEGAVVDVGAGTGYYLAHVLDALPERAGLALDISKYALRRAAKAHPRAGAVVCDAWKPLPLRDASAAFALNVFAPRNPAELHRILAPHGTLAVVTPTARHLRELVGALGLLRVDEDKKTRLDTALAGHFTSVRDHQVAFTLGLAHHDVATVVGMGPSAWHTDPARLRDAIAGLPDPFGVTAEVTLSVYAPNPR